MRIISCVLKDYVREMRIKNWYKALIVIAGPFFTGKIFSLNLINLLYTFFAFCLISSSIYVINDIRDADRDRLHPRKRFRPIASGRMKKENALIFSATLFILAVALSLRVNALVLSSVVGYFLLFLLYTFSLKKLAVIDSFVIALGYLIRAVAGCWATGITITPWFYLMIFSFAVYLAFCKRYTEVKFAEIDHKENLKEYKKMVEMGIAISGASSLAIYSIYSINSKLVYTVPLAFLGLMLHLRETTKGLEVSESLFKKDLLITFVSFLLMILFLLYF